MVDRIVPPVLVVVDDSCYWDVLAQYSIESAVCSNIVDGIVRVSDIFVRIEHAGAANDEEGMNGGMESVEIIMDAFRSQHHIPQRVPRLPISPRPEIGIHDTSESVHLSADVLLLDVVPRKGAACDYVQCFAMC